MTNRVNPSNSAQGVDDWVLPKEGADDWVTPPPETKVVQPPSRTTAPGVVASIARGLTPVAAGAAVGGAIGGPPGAAVGAGMVGGTELVTGIYNQVASAMGWPKTATPQEMTDRLYDVIGIRRPSTGAERVAESAAASVGGTTGLVRGAERVAATASEPLLRDIAIEFAKRPGAQQISSGLSGAAAQTAAEAGAGPLGQWAAGTLTAAAPTVAAQAPKLVSSRPKPSAVAASQLGYRLPPGQVSDRPGLVSGVLGGWGGKLKLRDDAYTANQPVTTGLARADLGLTANDPTLHPTVLEDIRAQEANAYRNVGASVQSIDPVKQQVTPMPGRNMNVVKDVVDPDWEADLDNLGQINAAARAEFPEIVNNKGIDDLRDVLRSKRSFTPEAALGTIQDLRYKANGNFQARDNPEQLSLAVAQKQAAEALEDMVERDITAKTKDPTIVENWRRARERMAKTWDIQYALTPEGEVSAQKLSLLNATNRAGAKRRALSGNLLKIAETYANYPKALAQPRETELYSHWDYTTAVAAGLGGLWGGGLKGAALGAFPLLRPLARRTLLSRPYQGRPGPYDPSQYGILPYVAPSYGIVSDVPDVPR